MCHYSKVTESTTLTYGKLPVKCDYFIMRLRLGYKICGDGVPCKLCHRERSHTLRHYIMECCELEEFRNHELGFEEQICYLINNCIIRDTVKKIKHFNIRF